MVALEPDLHQDADASDDSAAPSRELPSQAASCSSSWDSSPDGSVCSISSRTDEIGFDPRISARYIPNDDVTLKASAGVYHQYLKLATDPIFPISDVWLPVDSTQAPSACNQFVLGVATQPFGDFSLEIETYYKSMTNLVEIRPNIISGKKLSDVHFVGNGRG